MKIVLTDQTLLKEFQAGEPEVQRISLVEEKGDVPLVPGSAREKALIANLEKLSKKSNDRERAKIENWS